MKPNKQLLGFYLNGAACLLAIACGLCMLPMAFTCGLGVGLALSVLSILGQAFVSALCPPNIKRRSRPLLLATAWIIVTFVVGFIAVDLAHSPIMEGAKYVGMGVAIVVFESVCLALAIAIALYSLLITLRQRGETVAEVPDEAPQQTVDTAQLVAQAQDVVLRNKINVEEAPPPERMNGRRTIIPQEVRMERQSAPVPPVFEEEPRRAFRQQEEIKPEPVVRQEPIVESHEEPVLDVEDEEPQAIIAGEGDAEWEKPEQDVVLTVHGGVDQESGAPLHDADIRSEFAVHHPRQNPQKEDDSLYTDFGYEE